MNFLITIIIAFACLALAGTLVKNKGPLWLVLTLLLIGVIGLIQGQAILSR